MPPLAIPTELKAITPYVRRAEELDKDKSRPESRLVAYYCRQFAVQTGIPLASSSHEAKACLTHLLNALEKEKAHMDQFTRPEALYICRQFAYKIFDQADGQDRQGVANKATAKTFYTSASFLQMLAQFYSNSEEVSEDEASEQAEDKKRAFYAKWKATDIVKATKEGRTPQSGGYLEHQGPLGDEDEEEEPEKPSGLSLSPSADQQEDEDAPHDEPPTVPPPVVETVFQDDDDEEEEQGEEVPLNDKEEEEEEEEEEDSSPPPPAYPGPAAAPSKPVAAPKPVPAPKPVAPPKKSWFGGRASAGKATKAQLSDATELTRFALAALEDKDADLAAQRLQEALSVLGK